MKKLIFLFIIISLLISCSENTDLVNNEDKRDSNLNPYDYCGIDHNNALDVLYDYPCSDTLSELEQIEIILSYFLNKYPDDEFDSPEDILDLMNEMYDEDLSITDKGNLLYLDGDITSAQLEYFEELDDIICEYSILSDLEYAIDDLEKTLYEDNNLTSDEKIIIWGTISVTRNSAVYWYIESEYENALTLKKKPRPEGYTGTRCGEIYADAIGWIDGLFHNTGDPLKSASSHSASHTRRYIYNHTPPPESL